MSSTFEYIHRALPKDLVWEKVDNCENVPAWILESLRKGEKLYHSACYSGMRSTLVAIDENEIKNMLDMCEDFVWEQLNTGHWKDVPILWRKLFSYIAFLKVVILSVETRTGQELLRICDNGLLMGAPICGNILASLATLLQQHENRNFSLKENVVREDPPLIAASTLSLPGKKLHVPSITSPSLEYFGINHFQKQYPLIITNAIQHWPASKKWSPEYIRQVCGSRTVPVEIGSKYTADDWTQKLMTIQDFVDHFMNPLSNNSPSQIGYVAQHTLFDQIPELRADIRVPEYCCMGESEDVEINAWFGPAGTLTPTHFDPKHNLLGQVFGTKFVRLFPPSESERLYPHEQESILSNTSQVDMEDPDVLIKYPELERASYADIHLLPGSMLYIPPRWWHMVKSLSSSFSVSFWFQ